MQLAFTFDRDEIMVLERVRDPYGCIHGTPLLQVCEACRKEVERMIAQFRDGQVKDPKPKTVA